MRNKYIYIICALLFYSSCSSQAEHFYSSNRKQCISIITDGNLRYIINGYSNSVPKDNYIKVDLSKIDRHVGDEIVGCWNKDKFEWIIMMNNVSILENRLDTSKFVFKKDFPVDSSQIPTLKGYSIEDLNCFHLGFEYKNVISVRGDILR